ncbi:hypothetical protein [Halanaerobium congolense]|jgi:predicted RNA-binding Zn-ribbon protein involved in translation (DUF1610 family)|nr:hypothetical protein [Halanaerobium congolense]
MEVISLAYKKKCPDCKGKSYSSSKKTKWTCPYCGKDLKDVPAKRATG